MRGVFYGVVSLCVCLADMLRGAVRDGLRFARLPLRWFRSNHQRVDQRMESSVPSDSLRARVVHVPPSDEPPSPFCCDECDRRAWYSIVCVSIGYAITFRLCRQHAISLIREHTSVVACNLIPEVAEWLVTKAREQNGIEEE